MFSIVHIFHLNVAFIVRVHAVAFLDVKINKDKKDKILTKLQTQNFFGPRFDNIIVEQEQLGACTVLVVL